MNLATHIAIAQTIMNIVVPPPVPRLAGDLPANSSSISIWEIWGSNTPQGPFRYEGYILTNYFEIPMTNTQHFYLFYPN